MLRGSSAARKNYGAPVEKLCWSCLSPTLNLFHPPCPFRLKLLDYLELCQIPHLPYCISISSPRPSLIRSDEALWRNVIFSIKIWKIKTWIYDVARFVCCTEKLWRSRWKTVLKLPLSDAEPISSSLPFSSQAARLLGTLPSSTPSLLYIYLLTPTVTH